MIDVVADRHRRTDFGRAAHCLLGLPIDAIGLDEALERVRRAVSSRKAMFISTPNTNYVARSRDDAAFRSSITHSDLSLLDGMPLLWIARLQGVPIKERVAGADLFEALSSGRAGPLGVYFFGGEPGVARAASEHLNAAQGLARCVGFHDPGFGSVEEMSDASIVDAINASGADFVAVALGAHKGQAWIERNRSRLEAPIVAHLGATLNFSAHRVRRAPTLMQNAGLEWLWRIKEEPALWRRYLGDAKTLLGLVAFHALPLSIERRHDGSDSPGRVDVESGPPMTLRPIGDFPSGSLAELRAACDRACAAEGDIVCDLSRVGHVDSAFFGLLLLLHGRQSKVGLGLRFVDVDKRVARLFTLHCVEFMLDGLDAS